MNRLKVEIYGESHAEKIGVKLSGLPIGAKIDRGAIEDMLARSARLGEMFFQTPAYQNARTVYGYLPYNRLSARIFYVKTV